MKRRTLTQMERSIRMCVTVLTCCLGIVACDVTQPAFSSHRIQPRFMQQDTTPITDTVPCMPGDVYVYAHCPLTAPQGFQSSAIDDGIMDTTCPWMENYLMNMRNHGNINMYSGFNYDPTTGVGQMADTHMPGSVRDSVDWTHDRMHLNGNVTNYDYLHWVIRHEAAHSYNYHFTEDQADSVANSCGADQKPYL